MRKQERVLRVRQRDKGNNGDHDVSDVKEGEKKEEGEAFVNVKWCRGRKPKVVVKEEVLEKGSHSILANRQESNGGVLDSVGEERKEEEEEVVVVAKRRMRKKMFFLNNTFLIFFNYQKRKRVKTTSFWFI